MRNAETHGFVGAKPSPARKSTRRRSDFAFAWHFFVSLVAMPKSPSSRIAAVPKAPARVWPTSKVVTERERARLLAEGRTWWEKNAQAVLDGEWKTYQEKSTCKDVAYTIAVVEEDIAVGWAFVCGINERAKELGDPIEAAVHAARPNTVWVEVRE